MKVGVRNHLRVEGSWYGHSPKELHSSLSVFVSLESGVNFIEPSSDSFQGHCCRCSQTDRIGSDSDKSG